jgi:hypothetical protein
MLALPFGPSRRREGEPNGGFLFKLEAADGTPAEPSSLSRAVPNWGAGETITWAAGRCALLLSETTMRVSRRCSSSKTWPAEPLAPGRSKPRGRTFLRLPAEPSAQVERGCGSVRGCTSGRRDPRRCAGRCTRVGSRSAARSDCGGAGADSHSESTWQPSAYGLATWRQLRELVGLAPPHHFGDVRSAPSPAPSTPVAKTA